MKAKTKPDFDDVIETGLGIVVVGFLLFLFGCMVASAIGGNFAPLAALGVLLALAGVAYGAAWVRVRFRRER